MKNPLVLGLCALYVQNGWDPDLLKRKHGFSEGQIFQHLTYLIENRVIALDKKQINHYQYLPPENKEISYEDK